MAYATQQDLVDRYGELELIQLTDRVNVPPTTVNATVVTKALADADELIDGHAAAAGLALPLDPVPALVKQIACAIARYRLHAAQATEQVRQDYEDALRTLRDLAAGRVKLQAAGVPAPGGGKDVLFVAPGRTFTHDSLKDF